MRVDPPRKCLGNRNLILTYFPITLLLFTFDNFKDKHAEKASPADLTMVIYSEVQPSQTTENTFRIQTTPPTTPNEESSQDNPPLLSMLYSQ